MSEQYLTYSLIPLSSDEPLWEWDLVSDTIYLSHGALKSLNLKKPPSRMEDFYQLLPPDAASELAAVREGVISGRTGSYMECSYICNGLWAHEYLMVLSRNSEGRATRAMGRITATQIIGNQTGFRGGMASSPDSGLWFFDLASKKIWLDRKGALLLGLKHADGPVPSRPAAALLRIHPAERKAMRRHYDIFCEGPFLGDQIFDLARVRHADGSYLSLIISAAALERDKEGKALFIGGIISQNEPRESGASPLIEDDRLFHALNGMGSGQWNWDTKNDVMFFCSRYLAILGYDREDRETFARNWRDYIHPDDLAKVGKAQLAIVSSAENGDTYECTYRMRRADGGWAWIFDRGYVAWRDADGIAGQMLGSITNITTAQAERDRLEELVRHDSLTGLRSRAFCNLEIEHVEQNRIRPVCVISVDITGLKMVNDTMGHAAGDELLTKAALILRHSLRASDCIARIGGDEFLVLLPNCDQNKGEKLLAKIVAAFEASKAASNHMPVYAACGLAVSQNPDESMDHVIALADEAMYEDKKAHRKAAHAAIRQWIKLHTGKDVAADDRLD